MKWLCNDLIDNEKSTYWWNKRVNGDINLINKKIYVLLLVQRLCQFQMVVWSQRKIVADYIILWWIVDTKNRKIFELYLSLKKLNSNF